MKAEHFKILWDGNEQFRFNPASFTECIISNIGIVETSGCKHANRTQSDIIQQISDKCKISFETVKKWKYGDNGPGDIELVKTAAEVLNVNYHILLTSIDKKDSKMKEIEKETISAVREGCIEVFYAYKKADRDARRSQKKYSAAHKEGTTQQGNSINFYGDYSPNITNMIENLRMLIDKRSNDISSTVRYKLLNIILELYMMTNCDFSHRWSQLPPDEETGAVYVTLCNEDINSFLACETREDALKDEDLKDDYLRLEIALAERLGFIDTTNFPEGFLSDYFDYCKTSDAPNILIFYKQYHLEHMSPENKREIDKISKDFYDALDQDDITRAFSLFNKKNELTLSVGEINNQIDRMDYITPDIILTELVLDAINNVFRKDFPEYCN